MTNIQFQYTIIVKGGRVLNEVGSLIRKFLKVKQGEKYRLEIPDLTGDETGTRVEIFIPEEN